MRKEDTQNLIKELIEKTGIKINQINITEENPENIWFSVEVNEPHFFISNNGEALYALNHLIRRMSEGGELKEEPSITIDINGFQKKRVDAVQAVAHMMSERARYFKSNVEIDPMSSFERRVVHEFLSNAEDLKTESVGFGPTRRVVIKYVGDL